MTKVLLGGEEVEADLDNFEKLDLAWPHIIEAQKLLRARVGQAAVVNGVLNPDVDPMPALREIVVVLAIAISEPVDAVRKRLKPTEMMGLVGFFQSLMTASAVTSKPGEPAPAPGEGAAAPATESLSTETSPA